MRRDIVATMARVDDDSPDGIGQVLGTYLLGVPDDVEDDEIVDECIRVGVRHGVISLETCPDEVAVGYRDADPVADAMLYAQGELMRGAVVH